MIEADGLTRRYGETTVVDSIDLAVREGTVCAVLGPNGAGKTTTVRMLATLLRATSGSASVGGHDIRRNAHRVRQLIGLTGQYASVDENLSGRDNLTLIGKLWGMSGKRARARADQLLTAFDLVDVADRAAGRYSGGIRRRLDLATSLVANSRVLFLDEPTTGLDPRSRSGLWETVRELVADGVTVLLTTQYLDEAAALADHIVVIDQGRVVADGTPNDLRGHVGGRTLTVRPRRPRDLPLVQERMAAALPEALSSSRGGVRARIEDIDGIQPVIDRLAGLEIAELSMNDPSLEETFFRLTERPSPFPAEPAIKDIP
ncbi:ATP-binding cassette domain-containing protein [Pseudonocardia sp. NPDC046786]|uniref:ATP-binding cassette domain-containing protein n=1 Tax=Pseudonocardia sp. NPDC046786 TaxID=3155471 RepID=UPI0033FF6952